MSLARQAKGGSDVALIFGKGAMPAEEPGEGESSGADDALDLAFAAIKGGDRKAFRAAMRVAMAAHSRESSEDEEC